MENIKYANLIWDFFISTVLPVVGLVLAIIAIPHKVNPFSRKYKDIVGDFVLYNYSREHKDSYPNKIVVWDVSIRRLVFLVKVKMNYIGHVFINENCLDENVNENVVQDSGQYSYKCQGDVKRSGNRMTFFLHGSDNDPSILTFYNPSGYLYMAAGILCGYSRKPDMPYAGVHVICRKTMKKGEAIKVLMANRTNYAIKFGLFEEKVTSVLIDMRILS